jgi:diaminohydroxyphosphoribosylaminopyrimidine deaminase/5-amino-6-(5-phosphoribosylamino)uracil reductase
MNWRPQMDRALALAALGAGTTSPNPMVGAVVLDAAGQSVFGAIDQAVKIV